VFAVWHSNILREGWAHVSVTYIHSDAQWYMCAGVTWNALILLTSSHVCDHCMVYSSRLMVQRFATSTG
jgi:hypothetical protein